MTKQKYMENGKPKIKCIRINNGDINKVKQFTYLGFSITNNNNIPFGINHKIKTGTNAIMNCEIYLVSKLQHKGTPCKI